MSEASQIIKIDELEYSLNDISDTAQELVRLHKYATKRIIELKKTKMLLARAKNSYVASIKAEILSAKSGFDFLQE